MLPFRKTAKHTKAKSSLKRLNKHQNQSLIGHFPGGPVVRKPQFHCRDAGSIPGQRTRIPHAMCCAPQPKNKTKEKKKKSHVCYTHWNYQNRKAKGFNGKGRQHANREKIIKTNIRRKDQRNASDQTLTEMDNVFDRLVSRLDIAEERNSWAWRCNTRNFQNGKAKRKDKNKNGDGEVQNIQEPWETIKGITYM